MTDHRKNLLTGLLAAALVLPFFLRAHAWLEGREWPMDVDLLRNAGQAQCILDGRGQEDPVYAGEVSWYPPLVPALTALVSACTGLPIIHVEARWGLWFNLASLILYVLVCVRLLGRRDALLALAAFLLLLNGGLNTYSEVGLGPWMDPINAMLGPFFIGLLCLRPVAEERPGWWRYPLAGIVAGIVFLGHPGSTMTLSATLGFLVCAKALTRKSVPVLLGGAWRAAILYLPFMGAIAAVILYPLWERYGLRTENPDFSWTYGPLDPYALPRTVMAIPILPLAMACYGIFMAMRRRSALDLLLLSAMGAVSFLFIWSTISNVLFLKKGDVGLPLLVLPNYHFWYHVKTLLTLFFGLGAVPSLRALSALLARKWNFDPEAWTMNAFSDLRAKISRGRAGWLATTLAVTLYGGLLVQSTTDREITFNHMRRDKPDTGLSNAYAWIMSHTTPQDVFICSDFLATDLVSPAARKLIANHRLFSNPYVDLRPRLALRDSLFARLRRGDTPGFLTLARECGADHLAVSALDSLPPGIPDLEPAYMDERTRIYRLNEAGPAIK